MEELPPVIVFFDAECLLCNRSVQWLMAHDREGSLHYAPLGGETAQRFVDDGVLGEVHQEGKSIVVVERGGDDGWVVRTRSEAVIRAMEAAGGAPVRLAMLRFVPRVLRDVGYRLVAWTRYVIFGRTDACVFPDAELRERVLQ